MPITNFDFPGVTLKQVFTEASTGNVSTLGVACVGLQYKLHRADVASEAALVPQESVAYSPATGLEVNSLPGRSSDCDLDTVTTAQHLVVSDGEWSYLTADSTNISPTLSDNNKITFTQAVKDGDGYTAYTGFGTRGAKIGDTVVLKGTVATVEKSVVTTITQINKVTGKGYAEIQVESFGDVTTAATSVSVQFCATQDCTYEQSSSTFSISSAGKLTIQGGLTTKVTELSGTTGTLIKGTFYIEYREIAKSYVGKLGSIDDPTEVEEVLGGVCADNPLAIAVFFASKAAKGNTVFFTCVDSETVAEYEEALDFLERYPGVYSVVPATEDSDILKACVSSVVEASEDEDSKIRRALWFGITTGAEVNLTTCNATLTASSTGVAGTAVFTKNVFVDYPWQTGDYVERVTTGDRYKITATDGLNTATLDGTVTAVSTAESFKLVRTEPKNADLITAAIAKRAANSYRAQGVWSDDIIYNGEVLANYVGAAAAAGMRSYEACHRPLSNLGYDFFSVAETHGFTRSQLKQLGANGIWIIAQNSDGTPINMKQITTAMANNVNLDEESVIANADEIALALCHVGEDMVGCSNISSYLINALADTISLLMDSRLVNKTGSIYIGPQLLEWELEDIYQDTVNLDWVYASITCTPPKPFNKFNMTVRIV